MAMDMMAFIEDYTYKAGKRLHIKIGVHYGSCIFGVLGYHKPQFSLIGDTINTTSRHCTTGDKGRIVLSEACYQEIKGLGICKFRKMKVNMKGKGDNINIYVIRKIRPQKVKKNVINGGNGNHSKENSVNSLRGSNRLNSQYEFGEGDSILEDARIKGGLNELLGSMNPDNEELEADPQKQEDPEVNEANAGDLSLEAQPEQSQGPPPNRANTDDAPDTKENKGAAESELTKSASKPSRFLQHKTFKNSEANIVYSLVFSITDMAITEIYYWTDPNLKSQQTAFRLLSLMCIVLQIILLTIKQLRNHPKIFKIYLAAIILCRHLLLTAEYVHKVYTAPESPATHYQLMYVATIHLHAALVDGLFIASNGCFGFEECCGLHALLLLCFLSAGVVRPAGNFANSCYRVLNSAAFDLLTAYRTCRNEARSFFRIVEAKKKSAYLSKFVDRLLPKHVVT